MLPHFLYNTVTLTFDPINQTSTDYLISIINSNQLLVARSESIRHYELIPLCNILQVYSVLPPTPYHDSQKKSTFLFTSKVRMS